MCFFDCIQYGSKAYNEAVALRDTILRKPLGLRFSTADLARDKTENILTAILEDKVIGVLHLCNTQDNTYKLRQMAIAKSHQNNGIGSKLLAFAIAFSKEQGKNKITLHARQTALPFYKKSGFVTIGPIFKEVGIPHCKMELTL